MAEKFGLKNMNKKYKILLNLDKVVYFKLTERGRKYLQEWNNKNPESRMIHSLDENIFESRFSDLLAVFGPSMFVGAFNMIESNTVSLNGMDFNLNDKITFNLNENGKDYLENFLIKEQEEYKLENKRKIRKNEKEQMEMTLHDFAHTFSEKLVEDNNIVEKDSILEIAYQ